MEFLDKSGAIKVRLLNGTIADVKEEQIVGYCHYELHKGYVSSKLIKIHNCALKECPFLQRYEPSYWNEQLNKERKKRLRKIKKIQDSYEQNLSQDRMEKIKHSAQKIANQYLFPIFITGVSNIKGYVYSIHYVSAERKNDWQKYYQIIDVLKEMYKGLGFTLRHVKKLDGSYATFKDLNSVQTNYEEINSAIAKNTETKRGETKNTETKKVTANKTKTEIVPKKKVNKLEKENTDYYKHYFGYDSSVWSRNFLNQELRKRQAQSISTDYKNRNSGC